MQTNSKKKLDKLETKTRKLQKNRKKTRKCTKNVISERILTNYRTTLRVCYFLLYVVAISLIVCQNALCHFVY